MIEPKLLTSIMAVALMAPSMAVAHEEEDPQVNRVLGDRFSIRLLGGLVDINTDVAAGSSLGALIDLEDILGFDEEISTFGFEGFWRFSKNRKHSLRTRYGNFDRDAETVVEGTVPIFDVDFLGEVKSSFINQVATLEYQYSFTNHHKTEAGISAGFAFYKYDLTLEGQVIIDNNPDEAEFRSENVGVVAPVPSVGFFVNQALRQNLILELRTSFIDLEIGEHNGRIFSSWGSLTWYFTRHFGVGLGLTGADIVYDKKSEKERLKVELRQSALTVNVSAAF